MNSDPVIPCPRRHPLPPPPGGRRAVFLDRDGVLVADPGYLRSPDALRLLPGVPAALRGLRAAGWRLVVVTNQSAIARGWLSEAELAAIHGRLLELLADGGAELDALYYCPHHPEATEGAYRLACPARKPRPGMLRAAELDLGLALDRCWLVGDQERDVETARLAGARGILIAEQSPPETAAVAVARSLQAAARIILR